MFRFFGNVLAWFRSGTLNLLLFAVVLLLLWGTLAPVGTLVWWIEQGSDELEVGSERLLNRSREDAGAGSEAGSEEAAVNCYIVFLTGVGDVSADQLASGEEIFLDQLEQEHPYCLTVRDVFPYSAANQDIGGQQIFEYLWQVAEEAEGWLELTKYVLQARNVWRLALSADDRYGAIYNQAIALSIAEQMENQQPIPDASEDPLQLILMGTSGGAQVALGAAPYLRQWLPVEITVVSLGGVFDGNTGFDHVQQIYHLHGERDWIDNISSVLFPSRWRWTVGSPFNRARRQERYTALSSGPHEHEGDEGYFGETIAEGDNTTYLDLTLQRVNELSIWSDLNN